MEANLDDLTVVDNPAERRYEAPVGDALAIINYRRTADRIIFLHTEVPPSLESRGIAGKMARFALEDACRQGLAVVPRCPYVAAYIRRHPEYADLVPPDERARVTG